MPVDYRGKPSILYNKNQRKTGLKVQRKHMNRQKTRKSNTLFIAKLLPFSTILFTFVHLSCGQGHVKPPDREDECLKVETEPKQCVEPRRRPALFAQNETQLSHQDQDHERHKISCNLAVNTTFIHYGTFSTVAHHCCRSCLKKSCLVLLGFGCPVGARSSHVWPPGG